MIVSLKKTSKVAEKIFRPVSIQMVTNLAKDLTFLPGLGIDVAVNNDQEGGESTRSV